MDCEKKYKEALEWARKVIQGKVGFVLDEVLKKFPEIKESEDDRMREELIKYLPYCDDISKDTKERWIAWLKKQGEQKQKQYDIDILEKHITKDSVSDLVHTVIVRNGWEIVDAKEQKLAKIEPKFHKGDMIIHKELGGDYIHNSHKIIQVDILDKEYRLEGGLVAHFSEEDDYELVEQKSDDRIEPKFKVGDTMRTLQEANDGYTEGMPIVVSIDNEYYHCTNELISIKDQDDYEFPPINVKQKPTWSDDDEKMMQCIHQYVKASASYFDYDNIQKWFRNLKKRMKGE